VKQLLQRAGVVQRGLVISLEIEQCKLLLGCQNLVMKVVPIKVLHQVARSNIVVLIVVLQVVLRRLQRTGTGLLMVVFVTLYLMLRLLLEQVATILIEMVAIKPVQVRVQLFPHYLGRAGENQADRGGVLGPEGAAQLAVAAAARRCHLGHDGVDRIGAVRATQAAADHLRWD